MNIINFKLKKNNFQNAYIIKKNKEFYIMNIINLYNTKNVPFYIKDTYKSIIPLNIYQTWHTKDLPPKMKENYNFFKKHNPEFNHYLYDENDCREFIKNNFNKDVLNAFDSLIPCAYKADLWRYCVLYINGGIYIDIKFKCVNGFKLIALTENEFFVRDKNPIGVLNGLIITKSKNELLLKVINKIVENVKLKYYGEDALQITGPNLLGRYFTQEEKNNMELCFDYTLIEGIFSDYYILYNTKIILKFYKEYRDDQKKTQKVPHYSVCWLENKVYKV